MKNIKNKLIVLIFIALLITCLFCGSVGCIDKHAKFKEKIKETEYFQYIINSNNGVIILGLTELGKEQSILVIPEYIDNLPVCELGTLVLNRYRYGLESKNLKKLYIEAPLEFFHFSFTEIEELKVVLIKSTNAYIYQLNLSIPQSTILIANDCQELISDSSTYAWSWSGLKETNIFLESNIVYYVSDRIYWLDYIGENEQYLRPQNPNLEGGEFIGWYTEPELVNEWDGEYVIPEGQEVLNLYAKFN